MIVKALCTIHDSTGWHNAGDVFETEDDPGTAAVIVGAAKPEPEPAAEETPKPKTTRRKKASD